jgi:hypothetical protein
MLLFSDTTDGRGSTMGLCHFAQRPDTARTGRERSCWRGCVLIPSFLRSLVILLMLSPLRLHAVTPRCPRLTLWTGTLPLQAAGDGHDCSLPWPYREHARFACESYNGNAQGRRWNGLDDNTVPPHRHAGHAHGRGERGAVGEGVSLSRLSCALSSFS